MSYESIIIDRIRTVFQEQFAGRPVIIASPGRINLIGEHTDYNDGYVLPAAIDRRIYMALAANGTPDRCRLFAADLGETVDRRLDEIVPLDQPAWANYLLGVAAELRKAGAELGGFDCVFGGDIPIGGGMSSSAALENAAAVGLNRVFELNREPEELVRLSQAAEHHYAGVKCGIMDQFATMMGRAGQALLLDCRTLDYEYVPLDMGDFTLVLCDTRVSHSLADSAYNTRRRECEEVVRRLQHVFPTIQALRDLTAVGLQAERHRLDEVLFRRARHVVEENERVGMAVGALKAGDLARLGQLLYQSHASLQDDYEVSCPELDFLVDQTRDRDDVLGARMMGGGFGGCTLNLVRTSQAEQFTRDLADAYRIEMGREMASYVVEMADGTRVIACD